MKRKRSVLAAAAAVLALAPAAHGAPPTKAPEPPAPPPNVTLTLDAPSPTGTWRFRVENAGDVPVRLTADGRILSLEITPPNAKKPVVCALPADMRPTDDVERALVLPSKRSYSESFDPRLYCFGAHESALVAGAKVVAHLGFAPIPAPKTARATKPIAPFVTSPFAGVEPAVAPLKEIVGAPITLAAGEAPPSPTATPPKPPAAGDDPFPVHLSLSVPRHVESFGATDLAVTVTIANDGVRPVTLLFRPETIGFDLLGPGGATRCTWPAAHGGAVREAFTTLAPKAKQSVSVLLRSVCPDSAFDQGGLFVVRPRIDTRDIQAAFAGLHAFRGEVIGPTATLLRVHHGRHPPKRGRPTLD